MRVLVTGAAGAIGAAIVEQLAGDGHDVVAHDLRAVAAAPRVSPLAGDVTDATALARQLAELEITLDAVIAAHGVDGSGALTDLDDAFVRRVLRVNAASLPGLLAAVRPRLRAGGVFVAVGSQAGLVGESANAAYCASKFAVTGWALAVSDADVTVRLLCPGCTETPLLHAAQERFAEAEGVPADAFLARRRERIPLQRFAATAETAAAAVYLAATDAPRPRLLAATGGEVLW